MTTDHRTTTQKNFQASRVKAPSRGCHVATRCKKSKKRRDERVVSDFGLQQEGSKLPNTSWFFFSFFIFKQWPLMRFIVVQWWIFPLSRKARVQDLWNIARFAVLEWLIKNRIKSCQKKRILYLAFLPAQYYELRMMNGKTSTVYGWDPALFGAEALMNWEDLKVARHSKKLE